MYKIYSPFPSVYLHGIFSSQLSKFLKYYFFNNAVEAHSCVDNPVVTHS